MRNLFTLFFCVQFVFVGFSQGKTLEVQQIKNLKEIPSMELSAPDLSLIHIQDIEREKNGELYRIGVCLESNINTTDFGEWNISNDGSRNWKLRVSSQGAEALSFLFSKFVLYGETVLTIRDLNGKLVHKPMTSADVIDHHMQNAALCFGDDMIIEIQEPSNTQSSEIFIDRVIYNYRSTGNPNAQKINESDPCEVNVNCSPVGDSWQDEKDGVARVYCVEGNQAGWCTGSLVNNTAQNCKPYFLTALHCGVTSSTANMNQWRFYFRYESPNCNNPSSAGTLDDHYITGCFRIADSNDGGGNSGSDFLLVQMGAASNETSTINTLKSASFSAYWNGWNANNSASNGGASIHHPAGDIKKISTFNGSTNSTSWGSASGSHWQLSWSSNANGHGVTEGGSSGSPLFNNSGLIIGTLTGGSSYCTSQTSPDLYGKMSYHWTSNGSPNNEKLKPWLDPINSNAMTLNGSSDPCSAPSAPTTDFSANATNVSPGTTVSFSDMTSGVPDTWSWSITPGSGWSYAASTNSSSQNPQVTFNTVGQYTVQLTASNSIGSDTENKTNYIIVEETPCELSTNAVLKVSLLTDNYASETYLEVTNSSGTVVWSEGNENVAGNFGTGQENPDADPTSPLSNTTQYDWDVSLSQIDCYTFAIYDYYGDGLGASQWGGSDGNLQLKNNSGSTIFTISAADFGGEESVTVENTGTLNLNEMISNQVAIYPNPAEDQITIDLSKLNTKNAAIEIIDITGKTIDSYILDTNLEIQIDLGAYANGIYQVKVSNDGSTIMKQFVKK